MTINGVDLEFNLYDAENTEMQKRYEAELLKMQNIAAEQEQIQGAAEQTRFLCQRIKMMFDNVFGKGTGTAVCGEKNDLMICMDAYEKLVSDQIRQNKQYQAILNRIKRNGNRRNKK